MTISTYATLRQSVLSWGKRSDVLSLIDDFITLAESVMYANPDENLRIRDMEQTYTVTLGASSAGDSVWASGFWADGFWADGFWGSATEASRFIELPSRFIELRRVKITVNDREYWLDQKTPFNMCIRPNTGIPHYFTVQAELELDIVPDDNYALDLLYYGALEPISSTNTSNALLTRFPQVYLYGCLHQLHLWARNEQLSDYYYGLMIKAIQGANQRDHKGRYGPAPVIRMVGPTP